MTDIWAGLQAAFWLIVSFDADLVEITLRSLRVSLTALVVASLLALPFGTWLAIRRFRYRRATIATLNALMGLPFALRILVGPVLEGAAARDRLATSLGMPRRARWRARGGAGGGSNRGSGCRGSGRQRGPRTGGGRPGRGRDDRTPRAGALPRRPRGGKGGEWRATSSDCHDARQRKRRHFRPPRTGPVPAWVSRHRSPEGEASSLHRINGFLTAHYSKESVSTTSVVGEGEQFKEPHCHSENRMRASLKTERSSFFDLIQTPRQLNLRQLSSRDTVERFDGGGAATACRGSLRRPPPPAAVTTAAPSHAAAAAAAAAVPTQTRTHTCARGRPCVSPPRARPGDAPLAGGRS